MTPFCRDAFGMGWVCKKLLREVLLVDQISTREKVRQDRVSCNGSNRNARTLFRSGHPVVVLKHSDQDGNTLLFGR